MSTGASVSEKLFFILFCFILGCQSLQAEFKVGKIIFEGNESYKNNELKEILKTREKKEFDNKLLRLDKIILTNFYLTRGFLNVWVAEKINRQGERVDVHFLISEGQRFLLQEIKFVGAKILTADQLQSFFKIKSGDFFQQSQIEEGLNNLENFYFNNGKPYVEINPDQTFEDSLINVVINIVENETVYINAIEIRGLREVKDFIVGREMAIQKGEVYSRQKIEKSQKNIYSTGLFEFVGMELKTLDTSRAQAVLAVRAVEKKSKWVGVRFGVGYEQEIVYGGTFDFTLEFGHRNLFGTARSIYVSLIPSFSYDFNQNEFYNPKNQFSINYVEPWIGYTRTPGIFRFSFIQARPLNASNYDYYTTAFLIQHEFQNFWKISGALAYNRVQLLEGDSLDAVISGLSQGQDIIYSLNPKLVRDRRDNYLNPQAGSVTDFDVKFAFVRNRNNQSGEISKNRFIKMVVEWDRYQKTSFLRKWILASRVKIGNIFALDDETQIPVSERFYLGGASSVRGYPEQLLGPVLFDNDGSTVRAVGGKLMVLANIEFRIPLIWLLWGEVFVDAGNVWSNSSNFNAGDIKPTTGAGLAFLTPLGPIRFDYGIKLRPEDFESNGEFHISIAFAF
jgi:outer membrane protein insertion porin family